MRGSSFSPALQSNMRAPHNDRPISQPSENRFGIDAFAKALAASIAKMPSPERNGHRAEEAATVNEFLDAWKRNDMNSHD
jgi:hypothetical protein